MKMLDEEGIIAILKCPDCKEVTIRKLSFDDWYSKKEEESSHELHVCSCVSGGIYSVYFECPNPKCGGRIELM